jgi:poly-gamma-glutamate synthesis protein (capsule biosynthesis protein)
MFLCGDVMIGRGVDQIFPYSCPPRLYESYIQDARDYIKIAEEKNGPIPRQVGPEYIWGDALAEWQRFRPDVKWINLETSVTLSSDWVDKGINYRMHPKNVECLRAAGIDGCALANNHILDWELPGMMETLDVLHQAGIQTAGAGRDFASASEPAIFPISGKGRVLVFSFGFPSSGIPDDWAADSNRPGVWYFERPGLQALHEIRDRVSDFKKPGDLVVASIHWGPNWGYSVSEQEVLFAHELIDRCQIDLVHGHSSHHPKPFEVHHGKLILYGCGDWINDYEGISGYEEFRSELSLMYFAKLSTLASTHGQLESLEMVPTETKRFRAQRASRADTQWLADVLNREGVNFSAGVRLSAQTLHAVWDLHHL